jgi:hypothetical protein
VCVCVCVEVEPRAGRAEKTNMLCFASPATNTRSKASRLSERARTHALSHTHDLRYGKLKMEFAWENNHMPLMRCSEDGEGVLKSSKHARKACASSHSQSQAQSQHISAALYGGVLMGLTW